MTGKDDLAVAEPRTAGSEPTGYAWLITAMLVLLMLINWGDKAVLGLAAVPITEEFGLSHTEYGFLSSAFFFLFSISSAAVGMLAVKVRTRWILLVMALVWSFCQIPVLVGMGAAGLLFSRIALGAAEGPTSSLTVHTAHDWFPPSRRGAPTALTQIGGALGLAVAAPTLTALIVHFGWKSAFLALAVSGLVWAVVWVLVAKDGPYSAARSDEPAKPAGGPAAWRVFLRPTWWGGFLFAFAAYWALSLISAWLPTYLEKDAGFAAGAVGALLIVPPLIGAAAQLGATVLSDRLVRRGVAHRYARGWLLGGIGVFSGACVLAFPHVETPWLSIALLSVGLGAPGAAFPLGQLTTAEITPVRKRSAVLGWTVGLVTLAGLVAPAVTGRMVDAAATAHQGYLNVWTLVGVLLIAGAVIAMFTVDPLRDARALGTA
ncbi:MFS transporter [Saccharopolyspora sp. NPDC050389]|uniref:MFS transporter n=1 Tax=Saccharopolyspora sp. NPDC050389 TaxID=3155516 RepID=UPI0033FDB206